MLGSVTRFAGAIAATVGRRSRSVSRPGRARTATLAALGVLALAFAVLAGVGFWQFRDAAATAGARTDGLAAAMRLTPELLTYDYRTLPADAARAQAATTGAFGDQYRSLIDRSVKPNAPGQQLVTKATARDSAVLSASRDQVVALVFLSQVTTSTNLTAPRLDSSGVRVILHQIHGQWLIAGLDRL